MRHVTQVARYQQFAGAYCLEFLQRDNARFVEATHPEGVALESGDQGRGS
jgi:hypothetical protein